jgi:uncharacterized protein YjbJ (UPF0337 family)
MAVFGIYSSLSAVDRSTDAFVKFWLPGVRDLAPVSRKNPGGNSIKSYETHYKRRRILRGSTAGSTAIDNRADDPSCSRGRRSPMAGNTVFTGFSNVAVSVISFNAATMGNVSSSPRKEWRIVMNWEEIEGKWKQSVGKVKEKWGKLTDDDLTTINGKKEQLIGKIEERYGLKKEAAQKQVDEFARFYKSDN